MRSILFATTAVAALAGAAPAYAELFVEGSDFTVSGANTPGTVLGSSVATISDGVSQSLATTATPLDLTVNEFAQSDGSEWITFSYSGNPLVGSTSANWNINEVGLVTNQATTFERGFLSFDDSGANLVPASCSIFDGTVSASPVAIGGTGCLGVPVSVMNPAGPLPSLGTFIDPFSFISSLGPAFSDPSVVNSYFEALEFAPTSVTPPPGVPEPPSGALFALGAALIVSWAAKRKLYERN